MHNQAPTQAQVVASLPAHLRPFVKLQDHASQYTPRDHAVWRFLMNAGELNRISSSAPMK